MTMKKTALELRFHADPERTRTSKQAEIVARATSDESFRKALLEDSRAALSKELGLELPPGLNIRVVEETADTIVLVLPYVMRASDIEQLKTMATKEHIEANNTGHTAIQFGCCC